jgi:ligand-binding SRPBCC domain-containing protein
MYTHRFTIAAPLERVAKFHHSTAALKQLTPPPIYVQLIDIEPLGEGSRSEFTLWFGPLPIRWVAIHSEVDPRHGFVDTQTSGPYKFWRHRHTFRATTPQTTEIIDEVQAAPAEQLFWGLVSRTMWLTLPLLFAYRAYATRKAVEKAGRA